MDKDYKETERKVICVHGENLLIKVSGLFMGKYSTTAFEFWTSKEAYDRKQYRDGEKIYCHNWAVSEETALADWEKIVNKA